MLTIGITTYNSLEYTKFFIDNLRKNAGVPYHLIVVDNYSTDGTQEYLAKQKDIQIVLNKRNLGFGQGNNQAFARSQTPYFLGLNNDTVVHPGFLKRLLDFADQYPDYAEFGVHSNCIAAKKPNTNVEINDEIKTLTDTGMSPFEAVTKYYGDPTVFANSFAKANPGMITMEVPPNFIGGWCFLVRSDAVKNTGGLFDRRFKIGFWEDVDLSWRLSKAGYKIGLVTEVYLHHFTHTSFNASKLKLPKTDKAINRANVFKFADKWSDEIRNILNDKLKSGMSVQQIIESYHIFKVFFGLREDYTDLEEKLTKYFLNDRSANFGNLLRLKSAQRTN